MPDDHPLSEPAGKFDPSHLSLNVILLLAALTLGYSVFYSLYTIASGNDAIYPFLNIDSAQYALTVLQTDDPTIAARDPVYGTAGTWTSAAAYPWYNSLLWAAYHAGGDDFAAGMDLLRILGLLVFVPGMFLIAFDISHHWPASYAVALVATPVYALINLGQWAISFYPVSSVVYIVALPWIALAGLRWWFRPGWSGGKVSPWFVLGCGLLLGLSQNINAITAVNLIELLAGAALILALLRRLPWWSVPLLLAGALPTLLPRLLASGGMPHGVTLEGSRYVIDEFLPDSHFPWQGVNFQLLMTFQVTGPAGKLVLLIAHAALLLIGGLGVTLDAPRRKLWAYLLVTVEFLFLNMFLSTNFFIAPVFIYGCYRIWKDQVDAADVWLFILIAVASLIGPAQQTALYGLWLLTGMTGLTGIVFESIRFLVPAYLPLFILLARAAALALGYRLPRALSILRAVTIACVALARLAQPLSGLPVDVTNPLMRLIAIVLIIWLVIGWWLDIRQKLRGLPAGMPGPGAVGTATGRGRAHPALIALAVICAGLQIAVLALPSLGGLRTRRDEAHNFDLPPGYLEMAHWARDHTPRDSLFYLTTYYQSFRPLAERAIIPGDRDWANGMYAGLDPIETRAPAIALEGAAGDAALIDAAQRYGVDYLVEPLPGKPHPGLEKVYQNEAYVVYRFPA